MYIRSHTGAIDRTNAKGAIDRTNAKGHCIETQLTNKLIMITILHQHSSDIITCPCFLQVRFAFLHMHCSNYV